MTKKRPPQLSRTFGRTVIGSLTGPFSVTVTTFGAGRAVVTIAGDLDMGTVERVAELTAGLPRPESLAFVIDLTEVPFCSSVGLNLLRELHRRAELADVRMALVVDTFSVRRALRISGLDRIITVYRERTDALADFGIIARRDR